MAKPLPGRAVLTAQNLSSPLELRRAILNLAWPVLTEMILMTLTQIVDMAMVSRLGPVAISAIGLSFQPLFVAMAIFMGLAVGTTAVVARHSGAGEAEQASHTAMQSLFMGLTLALVLVILAYRYADSIVMIMGGEPEVVASGALYLRAMMPGVVLMIMRFVLASSLRGSGDTRTPMKISILVNILNVVFNWVLIFGYLGFPALGVQGAGIGTSLARSLGGILLLIHVLQPDSAIFLSLSRIRLDFSTMARVARVGIPAALERMVMSGGQILFVRIVAGLGTINYAAHAIAINAESISFMPAFAFAQAATTLVGQNLGAHQPEAASRSGWECFRLGCMVAAGGTVVLLLFPGLLMRIYTNDPELISRGVMCLRIMALAQAALAAGMIFPGALRGAGDTRSVLVITLIGAWVIRLGLSYLLVIHLGMGLAGAWLAMAVDWVFRGSATAWRFKRGHWKSLKV